jgi:hypothetical protein
MRTVPKKSVGAGVNAGMCKGLDKLIWNLIVHVRLVVMEADEDPLGLATGICNPA